MFYAPHDLHYCSTLRMQMEEFLYSSESFIVLGKENLCRMQQNEKSLRGKELNPVKTRISRDMNLIRFIGMKFGIISARSIANVSITLLKVHGISGRALNAATKKVRL